MPGARRQSSANRPVEAEGGSVETWNMTRRSHSIAIDEANGRICVHRHHDDDRAVLYTAYTYEKIKTAGFDGFALQLGEDLILDTGELRELLKP
jgi:hypothetical protein